jgi:hypothetical protein
VIALFEQIFKALFIVAQGKHWIVVESIKSRQVNSSLILGIKMRSPSTIHEDGVKDVLSVLRQIQPATYSRIDRECLIRKLDELMPYPTVVVA